MNIKRKCIIFTGGTPIYSLGFDKDEFKDCFIIVADSGTSQLERLNGDGFELSADVLLGDMDSFDKEKALKLLSSAEFLSFPPEKDYTDTQLALECAVSRGYKDILIVGGTGNRADHYLANLALLRKSAFDGIKLKISDGKNRITYCKNGKATIKKDRRFKYFSVIPDGEDLYGVTISGAKYPLWDARIKRDLPVSVSNEIIASECEITATKGCFFLIVCSD